MDVFDFAIQRYQEESKKVEKKKLEKNSQTQDKVLTPMSTSKVLIYFEAYRIILKLKYGIVSSSELSKEEWSILGQVRIKKNMLSYSDLAKYLDHVIKSYINQEKLNNK